MSKNGKKGSGNKPQPSKTAAVTSVSIQKREPVPANPARTPAEDSTAAAAPAASLNGDWLDPQHGSGAGTLQQQRAAFALHHVQQLATRTRADTKRQKQLNSYAAKMPFMVHANGLGQTAAFYRAKGEKDAHHDLYRLLGAWLARKDQPFAGKPELLTGITTSDLPTYVAAQAEAMLFLGWVKQFAAAFMENE